MEFLKKFFGIGKEDLVEEETKNNGNGESKAFFNACVVDYANICSLDLTDSFKKAQFISSNPELDIAVVVNLKRKDFFDKLEAISLVFKKFHSAIYFANGETDIEILRVLSKKIKQYGNSLLFTGDYAIIEAATNTYSPEQVAFVFDESSMSGNINSIKKRGYRTFPVNFITKKEGVIQRILKLRSSEIKQARGYNLSEEKEKYLLNILPNELDIVIEKALGEQKFKDALAVKYALVALCMKNKIDFYVNGNGNVKVRHKTGNLKGSLLA